MASLFQNAVSSIRMGVEDFRQQDPDRDVSAVRNFYAGVLLLAKEAIARRVPDADPSLVISARSKPVPDGRGGIEFKRLGHTTIDFQQICERAEDFGISIDAKALRSLNKLRNDMEHHFTNEPATSIRAAISKGFPVAASLFRQLDENPLEHLGESWTLMLETKELYEQEVRAARLTYSKVKWYSEVMIDCTLTCIECDGELVEQIDPENERQAGVELQCKNCGLNPGLGKTIERSIDELLGGVALARVMAGDESGPIFDCPACHLATVTENERICAACGEALDYDSTCSTCGADISVSDYLSGLDEGLCSGCTHMRDKYMME